MPKITLIARLGDGLPLAASMADEKDAYAGELQTYEQQAKKLVRTLASGQNTSAAVGAGAGAGGKNEYVTLESGDHFSFHYILSSGVVILTLTERAYPKRLAFDYLDELCREFFNVYGSQVARASRPYEFIRFDTFIQKTKKVYGDSRTQRNLDRISTELRDVHSIMTKNINDVISRGEKLENMAQKSNRLALESKRYAAQAKHANRMRVVRQYAPAAVVIVVVCVVWYIAKKMR